jgi:uncharacterized protein (DUF1697 family)
MNDYVALLRGINVGGKNKISMAELKRCLEAQGYKNVTTFINSGNVILRSKLDNEVLARQIEKLLSQNFSFDNSIIKVLALAKDQLKSVVDKKPKGFGEQPGKYHSDVIFLMGIDTAEAMKVFQPKEGVDKIWPGEVVIYSQRLSAMRTKSRLNKIMGTPAYKSMTIRNWNTTTKLLELVQAEK